MHAIIKAGSVAAEALSLAAKQRLKGGVKEDMEEGAGSEGSKEQGEGEPIPKGEQTAKGETRRKKGDEL